MLFNEKKDALQVRGKKYTIFQQKIKQKNEQQSLFIPPYHRIPRCRG
jgi:hypothetical protein